MASEKLTILLNSKDNASKTLKKVGASLSKLGAASAKVAAVGMAALGAETVLAVMAANKQEAAEAQLAATIKSTGGAAGLSAAELKKMASSLQDVTTFGDEAIISAQSVLLTFTKIGRETMPDTIAAVLDMSQALGTDLKSSSIQMGKALNDPIRGVSALSKAGVQFTTSQRQMIESMQNAGNIAGAQKMILSELETQFGGSAEAAAKTFGGALKQAGNALGDMQEEIGFTITKSAGMQAAISALVPIAKTMGAWVVKNRDYLRSLVADGISIAIDGFFALMASWQQVKSAAISITGTLLGMGKTLSIIFGGTNSVQTINRLQREMAGWDRAITKDNNTLNNWHKTLVSAVLPALQNTADTTAIAAGGVADYAAAASEAAAATNDLATAQTSLADNAAALDDTAIQRAQPIADEIGEGVVQALVNAIDRITSGVGEVVAMIAEVIASAMDKIIPPSVMQAISGFFNWLAETNESQMRDMVRSFTEGIVHAMRNVGVLIDVIVDNLDEIIIAVGRAILFELPKAVFFALTRLSIRMLDAMRNFFKNFGGSFFNFFIDLLNGVIKILNKMPFVNIKKVKHRADGGPIEAGQPYMVGERGPEMIIPAFSGTVVPNAGLNTASITINIMAADNPGETASRVKSALQMLIDTKQMRFDPIRNTAVA